MTHLLALGDSHLEALELAAELGVLNVESYAFSIVPGATAVGLRNPNAMTNAVNIFKDALVDQSKESRVLVHLGEVDCGFVIWWRAKTYGESVESQFLASIGAYREFLQDVLAMGFRRLCIVGASLPTIRDQIDFGDVANRRSEINVGIRERTDLTLSYNDRLRVAASELGIGYMDITDAVLNKSSHLVSDFFRNSDPTNHHLDKGKTVGVWAAMCNAFIADSE
jgi:hypothetical protein